MRSLASLLHPPLHRCCPLLHTALHQHLSTASVAAAPGAPLAPHRPQTSSHPYLLPSASSYLSLYRQLLRASRRFDDDVVRHFLRTHLRSTFRLHRRQHLTRHARETHHLHEQRAAQQWVKERIRCLTHSQPLPPPFVPSPPPTNLNPTASILPSTSPVSFELRRLLHLRYRNAADFLRTLERAQAGNRHARIRLLALSYGFAGPVLALMQEARARRLLDPQWWEGVERTYPLHPMQRAAVGLGMGMGAAGEEGEGKGLDWTVAYRLMALKRSEEMDREWRRALQAVLHLQRGPQRVGARKGQWPEDEEGNEVSAQPEGASDDSRRRSMDTER